MCDDSRISYHTCNSLKATDDPTCEPDVNRDVFDPKSTFYITWRKDDVTHSLPHVP